MPLVDFNQKVKTIIQDEAAALSSADIDTFILEALSYYSKDRPWMKVTDITGDGVSYQFALPVDWDQGFSVIQQVEYPAGERVPLYLEPVDWLLYADETTVQLRLVQHTPAVGELVRVSYSCLYQVADIDLVPLADQEAFSSLAASLCCGALARYYSQTTAAPLEIEVIDYPGKAAEYAVRSKELLEIYNRQLGKGRDKKRAASVTADWDTATSWQGDYLLHPRRLR